MVCIQFSGFAGFNSMSESAHSDCTQIHLCNSLVSIEKDGVIWVTSRGMEMF